ncbi:MAG TPA: hypothetical protein V6D19_16515 [Stenomitos sp.]
MNASLLRTASTIIGTSLASTSVMSLTLFWTSFATRAESSLPSGYTLSPTPLKGQHCYYYGGNRENYYCYKQSLETLRMKQGSMMEHSTMMKNGDSMMMKKDDASMQHNSMMKGK